MGDVIALPTLRTCFLCAAYTLRQDGAGHCEMFDERIDSEIFSAQDCNAFEPE